MNKLLLSTLFAGMLAPLAVAQQNNSDVLVADVAQDTLDIAEQLYEQSRAKNLDAASRAALLNRAAMLFRQVETSRPTDEQRGKAVYMRAACLSDLGKEKEAEPLLQELSVGNYGEYSAAAAYRLGTLRSRGGLWEKAETSFSLVTKKTKREKLRHDALYRMAHAQVQQGKFAAAEGVFRQLMATDKLDPSIYKASVLALANMKTKDNDDAQAYSYFLLLLERNDLDDSQRGMATLQAARLASRMGKESEAEKHYAALVKLPGMERYAGEAQMESILALYKQKNYAGVVKQITQSNAELRDKEKEARRALIVGQSYMELKQYEQAASWFSVAEEAQPGTTTAADASYRRIVCAQQCRSTNFINLIKKHLSTYTQPGSVSNALPCNDLVRLMFADKMMASSSRSNHMEESVRQANLQEAARQFDAINYDNLPSAVRPDAEYKRAWCAAQTDSYDPVPALDRFIANYKDNPRIPDAYALRGATLLKRGKNRQAMADFDTVINDYPDSAAAPMCMQKAAQAAGQGENADTARMIKYYESLIRCGSQKVKPSALAEAHYNIARARYDKDPAAAVDHFREARVQDSEHYGDHADMSIVQCYFKMKDAPHLQEALQEMERRNADLYKRQPPAILRWCGWTCYQAHNYALAEKYLGDSVLFEKQKETYTAPDGTSKERPVTEPLVWKTLARSRLETGKYNEGLEAAEHYLSKEDQPYRRAEGMRDKALLLVGLGRAEEARRLCEEAIELGIDGPIKSSLFLALGDAWYADGQYSEAAKYYGRTANFVNDKELKPVALYKIVSALKKAGKVSEAAQYETSLKSEFPNWAPTDSVSRLMERTFGKKQ